MNPKRKTDGLDLVAIKTPTKIFVCKRDNINDRTVLDIKIITQTPMILLFFILPLLKLTEMPFFNMI